VQALNAKDRARIRAIAALGVAVGQRATQAAACMLAALPR
jgi:hypothetical protein